MTPEVGTTIHIPGCTVLLTVSRILSGGGLVVEWDPEMEHLVRPHLRDEWQVQDDGSGGIPPEVVLL